MDAYLGPMVSCCLYKIIIKQQKRSQISIHAIRHMYNKRFITDIKHSPNYTTFDLTQTHQLK